MVAMKFDNRGVWVSLRGNKLSSKHLKEEKKQSIPYIYYPLVLIIVDLSYKKMNYSGPYNC